jgi:hypothetical protein
MSGASEVFDHPYDNVDGYLTAVNKREILLWASAVTSPIDKPDLDDLPKGAGNNSIKMPLHLHQWQTRERMGAWIDGG